MDRWSICRSWRRKASCFWWCRRTWFRADQRLQSRCHFGSIFWYDSGRLWYLKPDRTCYSIQGEGLADKLERADYRECRGYGHEAGRREEGKGSGGFNCRKAGRVSTAWRNSNCILLDQCRWFQHILCISSDRSESSISVRSWSYTSRECTEACWRDGWF